MIHKLLKTCQRVLFQDFTVTQQNNRAIDRIPSNELGCISTFLLEHFGQTSQPFRKFVKISNEKIAFLPDRRK